jgi:hypothetical protein
MGFTLKGILIADKKRRRFAKIKYKPENSLIVQVPKNYRVDLWLRNNSIFWLRVFIAYSGSADEREFVFQPRSRQKILTGGNPPQKLELRILNFESTKTADSLPQPTIFIEEI